MRFQERRQFAQAVDEVHAVGGRAHSSVPFNGRILSRCSFLSSLLILRFPFVRHISSYTVIASPAVRLPKLARHRMMGIQTSEVLVPMRAICQEADVQNLRKSIHSLHT